MAGERAQEGHMSPDSALRDEQPQAQSGGLAKAPTGIKGFDEISAGGLPRGRPTLVCGGAGCGKTLFGMEFLLRGATEHGEPGVFVSFEESSAELVANVASLGFDLQRLVDEGKIALDHIRVERSEIEETGEYDLEGLFIRLAYVIDKVSAKRIVLDTVESLFAALPNEGILRAELRRLFRWLKERGMTAVITGERGEGTLTRRGLEEYVSDCVIVLEQRLHERVATRHLRIVKYRGSRHGSNEYPFLIHQDGISVVPITSLGLDHPVSTARISLGIPRLDAMLGRGDGLYRGTSVLISGTAGSGKSSIAAHAADAACRRGERVLYFAFEESRRQIVRNMRSIGIDLDPWCRKGLLRFHAARPTIFGLEMHLATMHQMVEAFDPSLVIVDTMTNLTAVGAASEVRAMLTRLIDYLKSRQTTGIFISLTSGDGGQEHTDVGVSSLMDAWVLLQFVESSGERNRCLYVLKSRGMQHSNQVREFVLTDEGVKIVDVYVGPSGVMTGAARHAQEAQEQAEALARRARIERMQRDLARSRQTLEAQLAKLHADFEAEEERIQNAIEEERRSERIRNRDRNEMARIRQADPTSPDGGAARAASGDKTNGVLP
jgi:circadian clock protein KaiC